MSYKEKFLKETRENFLLENKKILVAVSGGLDSMVLLDLLLELDCTLDVAHANFQLRGAAADQDENFVADFCSRRRIPFYSKHFDTYTYMYQHKLSIQMAARELRHTWFIELLNIGAYDLIALGHHLDDSIETFFINLIRGTGIKGLLGIRPKQRRIIRPLLAFTRAEILSYALAQQIVWREDTSNQEDKYLRNCLRHRLIPILRDLSPDFHESFRKTKTHLADEDLLIEKSLRRVAEEITLEKTTDPLIWKISCLKLSLIDPLAVYLFKLFSPYKFNTTDLTRLLTAQSGKQLFSDAYRLIKNRDHWLLVSRSFPDQEVYEVNGWNPIKKPIPISFSITTKREKTAAASVDLDKVKLPLQLRIWRKGDYFYPLGMKTGKKLSKYFKDEQLSLLEKEQTWLLINAEGAIIWIIGRRLDERFKVVESTKKVLNIYLCT
ncbi:MAG: tRNA lysidine(34) synthetase TilS [Flavobacteriales bacterium AspAUS03]